MFEPKTYNDLTSAMRTGAEVVINNTVGRINGIAREDGSGRSFNVTLSQTGRNAGKEDVTQYVRTTD